MSVEGYGGEAECGGGADLPSTALFDLGNVQLEEVIEPCNELLSAEVALLESRNSRGCGYWAATHLDSPILISEGRLPNARGV